MVQSWDELPRRACCPTRRASASARPSSGCPPISGRVITLRDIEGWDAPDVCAALEISEANQRVLLHRARGKVRQAIERYFEGA